jgi:hypothetical protein
MERDDFTKPTKETLAKRVRYRCSNPNCPTPATLGPGSEQDATINLGVAAHITAASEGGPRFDSSLSPQERRSSRNGIWLCQNCAKRIDSDEANYPVPLLLEWKQWAERRAFAELPGTAAGELGLKRLRLRPSN